MNVDADLIVIARAPRIAGAQRATSADGIEAAGKFRGADLAGAIDQAIAIYERRNNPTFGLVLQTLSMGVIDTSFDMRTDAGVKDPDSHSATLRRYHQLLWSKPLPNGVMFDLLITTPGTYLHHYSPLGEFWLSSDSVMPTFIRWESMRRITSQLTR